MLCQRTATPDAAPSKAEGGEKDVDLSSGYSRGEGQKPVSKAYKENWNLIFAKKRKRQPPLSSARFDPSTKVKPSSKQRANSICSRYFPDYAWPYRCMYDDTANS
jgi:hypothetical protein